MSAISRGLAGCAGVSTLLRRKPWIDVDGKKRGTSKRKQAFSARKAFVVERKINQASRRLRAKRRMFPGMRSGFAHQTHEIESQRERVADQHGFGGIVQAKSRRAFELSAGLNGIAAFGIGLPAKAQLPIVGTDGQIAREADGTIGQGQAGGQRKTKWALRISKWTSLA